MTSILTERSITNDLQMGLKNEDIILNTIKQNFPNYNNILNTKQKYQDNYCKWDYECDDGNRFELKTRRIKSNTYLTGLISCHKADTNYNKKQYFIFSYLDKNLAIEYDKTLFDTFNIKEVTVNRNGFNGRGMTSIDRCFEIPINKMFELK